MMASAIQRLLIMFFADRSRIARVLFGGDLAVKIVAQARQPLMGRFVPN
jgi:hypothetical protein